MITYKLDLPEEPPTGSVLVDEEGIAYQSILGENASTHKKVNIYYPAIYRDPYGYPQNYSWAQLLIEKQPLRVIYRGEVSGTGTTGPANGSGSD